MSLIIFDLLTFSRPRWRNPDIDLMCWLNNRGEWSDEVYEGQERKIKKLAEMPKVKI